MALDGAGVDTFSNLFMSPSILDLAAAQSGAGAMLLMYVSTDRLDRLISRGVLI